MYHFLRVLCPPSVVTLVEDVEEVAEVFIVLEFSDVDWLFWGSLRLERCLHTHRDMSMARKKNNGKIKMVPINAYFQKREC